MDSEVKYLLSLGAVRDRAKLVGEAAQAGKLSNFDVHEERLGDVAEFVTSVIKVFQRVTFMISKFQKANGVICSEISVQITSTRSRLMVGGSTSRSAMYLA